MPSRWIAPLMCVLPRWRVRTTFVARSLRAISQERSMNVVAIPLFGTRISSRLDCTEAILLVSHDKGRELERDVFVFTEESPIDKVNRLVKMGVTALICGGITNACDKMLRGSDINIFPWIQGEAEDILRQFLRGGFQQNTERTTRAEGENHVVREGKQSRSMGRMGPYDEHANPVGRSSRPYDHAGRTAVSRRDEHVGPGDASLIDPRDIRA